MGKRGGKTMGKTMGKRGGKRMGKSMGKSMGKRAMRGGAASGGGLAFAAVALVLVVVLAMAFWPRGLFRARENFETEGFAMDNFKIGTYTTDNTFVSNVRTAIRKYGGTKPTCIIAGQTVLNATCAKQYLTENTCDTDPKSKNQCYNVVKTGDNKLIWRNICSIADNKNTDGRTVTACGFANKK